MVENSTLLIGFEILIPKYKVVPTRTIPEVSTAVKVLSVKVSRAKVSSPTPPVGPLMMLASTSVVSLTSYVVPYLQLKSTLYLAPVLMIASESKLVNQFEKVTLSESNYNNSSRN